MKRLPPGMCPDEHAKAHLEATPHELATGECDEEYAQFLRRLRAWSRANPPTYAVMRLQDDKT